MLIHIVDRIKYLLPQHQSRHIYSSLFMLSAPLSSSSRRRPVANMIFPVKQMPIFAVFAITLMFFVSRRSSSSALFFSSLDIRTVSVSFTKCSRLAEDCFIVNATHLTPISTSSVWLNAVFKYPQTAPLERTLMRSGKMFGVQIHAAQWKQQRNDYLVVLDRMHREHCVNDQLASLSTAILFLEDDFQNCISPLAMYTGIMNSTRVRTGGCYDHICMFSYGFGAVLFSCNMLQRYLSVLRTHVEPVDAALYRLPVIQFKPYVFQHVRDAHPVTRRIHSKDLCAACFASCKDLAEPDPLLPFLPRYAEIQPFISPSVPSYGICPQNSCQLVDISHEYELFVGAATKRIDGTYETKDCVMR